MNHKSRNFPAMQKMSSILAGGVLLLLLVFSCNSSNSNGESGASIDPLTGIDTSRALITDEELAQTENILLIPYREGNRWGYTDANKKVVVPPQYDAIDPFIENLAVVEKNGVFGVIDKRGREIIPPKFKSVSRSACGVFTIQTQEGFVLVNNNGKRVTNKVYPGAFSYTCSEGRIPVMENGKIGFIDKTGKQVIPPRYDAVFKFSGGVAPARIGDQETGRWGLVDTEGNEVLPFTMGTIFPFSDGVAVAMKLDEKGKEKWGVIDTQGKEVVPFKFGGISGSFSGSHVVCREFDPVDLYMQGLDDEFNTWYIYDRQGNMTGKTGYELWDDFSDGRVVMKRGNQFGYADEKGKVAIEPQFDWACPFQNGLAWVGKDSLYGFIDPAGQQVIPLKYAPVADYVFMEKWGARVIDPATGEDFYIDPSGKEFRKPNANGE
jgi:hypothetical protein